MVQALVAHDPDIRRQFTDMAARWHELAEQAARIADKVERTEE
jgi:hypothetical protein